LAVTITGGEGAIVGWEGRQVTLLMRQLISRWGWQSPATSSRCDADEVTILAGETAGRIISRISEADMMSFF